MWRYHPLHAVPIAAGRRYRSKRRRKRHGLAVSILPASASLGAAAGAGSALVPDDAVPLLAAAMRGVAVAAGLMRARPPQSGDQWARCVEARAAGSAPIYAGEPGYREGLDRDADGIACQAYLWFAYRMP